MSFARSSQGAPLVWKPSGKKGFGSSNSRRIRRCPAVNRSSRPRKIPCQSASCSSLVAAFSTAFRRARLFSFSCVLTAIRLAAMNVVMNEGLFAKSARVRLSNLCIRSCSSVATSSSHSSRRACVAGVITTSRSSAAAGPTPGREASVALTIPRAMSAFVDVGGLSGTYSLVGSTFVFCAPSWLGRGCSGHRRGRRVAASGRCGLFRGRRSWRP
jgi:hypothetical protein